MLFFVIFGDNNNYHIENQYKQNCYQKYKVIIKKIY